ncbi:MarR family winged helix-turn-helix transcriptional regulator [Actinomycetospora cinnamomea]|uniref:MarR family protein n=1 Tax=Actinomycetospora cinnamomea TaxID=663609 RepID=A0A2U1FIH0_9PSEU|nr:MarR family transcriptional regulator [Actinomycetospora cinnamomea]PVZ11780.1 MarR family protein [Actinomycetospora cinnamomea]
MEDGSADGELTGELREAERRWPATALVDRLAGALRRHHRELTRLLGLREVELACLQLVDRPRAMAMTAVAERLGLSRAATTAVVDRLVATGRVVRWKDPDDRRRVMVAAVAPPGETAPWRGLTRDLVARQYAFTDDELRVVGRWIAVMCDALHERAGDLTLVRTVREDAARRARRARR